MRGQNSTLARHLDYCEKLLRCLSRYDVDCAHRPPINNRKATGKQQAPVPTQLRAHLKQSKADKQKTGLNYFVEIINQR
jgi:hypothetical protein